MTKRRERARNKEKTNKIKKGRKKQQMHTTMLKEKQE